MGFLTIVRKMRQKEKEMKVLFLGLDNAGKTTVVKKFNGEETDTISPTLGFDIKTLVHKSYSLNIWDVGGQQTIRSYWRNYFEVTDGVVWVVDSADRWRLKTCRDELHSLMQQEQLGGASLLIFANKQDLPGAVSPEEIAAILELDSDQFKNRHYCIHACSAVTGEGLLAGVDWLVEDIASRIMLT
ncbi:ADP-ribosylation factor-like protein 2 [Pelagophyceae sp. CCMP2097]|nr:ADP-ribosylation factor-like protein 2 [Pelagophyceae sp. CCMP2097]